MNAIDYHFRSRIQMHHEVLECAYIEYNHVGAQLQRTESGKNGNHPSIRTQIIIAPFWERIMWSLISLPSHQMNSSIERKQPQMNSLPSGVLLQLECSSAPSEIILLIAYTWRWDCFLRFSPTMALERKGCFLMTMGLRKQSWIYCFPPLSGSGQEQDRNWIIA